MPQGEMQRELAQFFQNQIFMEKQIEKTKCELSRHPEFNLYQAYKLFDREEQGYITGDEFINSLTKITGKHFNRVLRE